jgi:sortase A
MKNLSYRLAITGLLAIGYCALELGKARLYQTREARRFTDSRPATAAPDVPPSPLPGAPIAELVIPHLDVSTVVVEGAGKPELELGPGHIQGTALPGTSGNVGIAGHRDTFFRPLRRIRVDDSIEIVTNGRRYRYQVAFTKIVNPTDVRDLYPTGRDALTLVTCYPFTFVGSAPQRFIVRANCIDCRQ